MFKNMTIALVSALALAMAATATAKDDMPDRTEDGLTRIESKNVDAVYWREGATLEEYNKVQIMEPQVAFRKNWQRDYNRTAASLSSRVSSDDMEDIKSALAAEFDEVFSEVLSEAGFEVVDAAAEDVLVLRPAIVNLDVIAPDLQSSMSTRSYTTTAGQMTLYMDLFDSATGSKIGTVVDAQRARDNGMMTYSSGVRNKQEARTILKKWSSLLADALAEAHKSDE